MSEKTSERIYGALLALYPAGFREEYGAAARALFRDRLREERGFFPRLRLWIDVLWDFAISIPKEHLRDHPHPAGAGATAPAADGPVFYQCEPEIPRRGALVNGAIATIAVFIGLTLFMGSASKRAPWLWGSHHPARSHLLPAHTAAVATRELDSKVTMKPMPYQPPVSPYFKLILVLGALDADHDNIISAEEIANSPRVLGRLDKNHDGKLDAEECGLSFGTIAAKIDPESIKIARLRFMLFHPVLAALDSDHDGVISAREMGNAAAALWTLDSNHDGRLTEDELLPPVQPVGLDPASQARRPRR